MNKLKLLISLVFLCFISLLKAQENQFCFEYFVGSKKLSCNNEGKIFINSKTKNTIEIKYNCADETEGFYNTLLVMNEQRITLLKQTDILNKNKFEISIKKLAAITQQKPFELYYVSTPKDTAIAATVRLKPIFITLFVWK